MLQALIHGKVHRWLVKNPCEIEDLLTSVVFGSCQYAGLEGWRSALAPFLGKAADSRDTGTVRRLDELLPNPASLKEVSYSFWPSFAEFVVERQHQSGSMADPIVVEGAIPELIISLENVEGRKFFLLIE
jgi:hypothetical protein